MNRSHQLLKELRACQKELEKYRKLWIEEITRADILEGEICHLKEVIKRLS